MSGTATRGSSSARGRRETAGWSAAERGDAVKVVWRPGDGPHDGEGLARPWLLYRDDGPHGQGWELYVAGVAAGVSRITPLWAPGPRPEGFAVDGDALESGSVQEEAGVRSPCATVTDDGEVVLVYAGDDGQRTHLCSARRHRDGSWQRLGVTLPAGQPGDADAAGCDHPALLVVGERRLLWYTARDGTGDPRAGRIAAASALAAGGWERHGVVVGRGAEGQPDELAAESPSALLTADYTIDLVYTGLAADGTCRVLRARSQDGRTFDRLGPVSGPRMRDACLATGPNRSRWLVTVTADGAVAVGRWDR